MAAKTWSLTTPADDALVDSIPNLVRDVKKHIQIAAGFYSEAQSTPDQTIAIYAGIVFFGTTKVEYVGLDVVDLGTAGAFEVSALTADYYNKVLFTIDSGGTLAATEGTEHAVAASVVAPAIPTGKFPVCMVTVQDDGNAGAGSILTIEQSEIQQLQSFAQKTGQAGTFCPDYNETDQGLTGNGKSAKAYIDTISTNSATLIFRHSSGGVTTTYTFGTSETIPSNINVIVEKGAVLSIATAQTLTINSSFDAGLYQVFSGAGSVVFGMVSTVYLEWWGLAESASASVNATALQAAFDAGAIVKMQKGTYSYDTGLTIDKAIKIDGSGSCEGDATGGGQPGNSTTKLIYTGSGVGITLIGSEGEGKENLHLSNFSLWGTVSADGGILVGSSQWITKSSLKNIHIRGFTKVNAYGLKAGKCLETFFENVYTQFNYNGIVVEGTNTTLNFTNCWSRTNSKYGWYIVNLAGGIFSNCLAESNEYEGLYIYGSEARRLDFFHWHSESNNLTGGSAPLTITGSAVDGKAEYINFFGGIWEDVVGVIVINLDYARRIMWWHPDMLHWALGFITCTANTADCHFYTWATDQVVNVVGNGVGRVCIHAGETPNKFIKTLGNGGTSTLPYSPNGGIFIITDITNNKTGILALNGSAHTVSELVDPDAGFHNILDNAGTWNIYPTGGTAYAIQNSTGAEATVVACVLNVSGY